MTNSTIDIDNYIHFEVKKEGKISTPIIHTSIFLGQAQDPLYSAEISFDYLLKEYIDSNAAVIKKQLLIAGIRLASVLKMVFKK